MNLITVFGLCLLVSTVLAFDLMAFFRQTTRRNNITTKKYTGPTIYQEPTTTTPRTTTTTTPTTTIDPALLPEWWAGRSSHEFMELSEGQRMDLINLSQGTRFMNTLIPIAVPRVAGTPGNRQVQQFIVGHMRNLGYTIELDKFQSTPPVGFESCQMTNIIATLDPEAPRRIVLACHYDSKLDPTGVFIGMSDSAVPCTMMIDLAESLQPYLTNRTFNNDVTLQLMFLDGEEAVSSWSAQDSVYGARNLAMKMQRSKNKFAWENSTLTELHSIDVMVLLDLIGTKDMQFREFYYTAKPHFERLANLEKELFKNSSVRSWGRTVPYFDRTPLPGNVWVDDDYRPFIQKGVRILHLISYPFPSVWHKKSDNLSNMHFETIDDILKILRIYLCEYLACTI